MDDNQENYEEYGEQEVFNEASSFVDIEKNVIKKAITCPKFRNTVCDKVLPEYFDDTYLQYVYRKIQEYHKSYKGADLSKTAFNTMVQEDRVIVKKTTEGKEASRKLMDLEGAILHNTINDIFDNPCDMSNDFLTNRAESYFRRQAFNTVIFKSANFVNGDLKDRELTLESFPALFADAVNFTLEPSPMVEVNSSDSFFSWVEDILTKKNQVPFKLDTFNKATLGGLARGTLSALCAWTNVGKTQHLISHAVDYARLGYNVLYISYEMGESDMRKRFFPNITGMSFVEVERLKDTNPNEFVKRMQQKYEQGNKELKGRLELVGIKQSGVTISMLEQYIDEMSDRGFAPDVVIIDQLQNVKSMLHPATPMRFHYGSIALEMQFLAKRKNCVVWTALQLNRESVGVEEITLAHLAESVETARTADFIYGILLDEVTQNFNCFIIKSRANFKTKFQIGQYVGQSKLYDIDSDEALNNDGQSNQWVDKELEVPKPLGTKIGLGLKL